MVFSIASDAHDTRELANVSNAVRNARRGWVDRKRVVNIWTAKQFQNWVKEKRSG